MYSLLMKRTVTVVSYILLSVPEKRYYLTLNYVIIDEIDWQLNLTITCHSK